MAAGSTAWVAFSIFYPGATGAGTFHCGYNMNRTTYAALDASCE